MNVKFLLDENMPFALTEFFKIKGYEAKLILTDFVFSLN